MDKLRVLIVDDEPIARDILESYIQKLPQLQLTGTCKNALEAIPFIGRGEVDLLLLDINMPEITGIEFVKMMRQLPWLIFTTAYSSYAVESYELNAVDYLLKPISFDRFSIAVDKVLSLKRLTSADAARNDAHIFVKTDGRLVKINLADLWMVEGLKDYVKLHLKTGKLVIHSTMKNIEDSLAGYDAFVRVHKSYIINMQYVSEVDGNTIYVNNQPISIGSTYKSDVLQALKQYKLL